MSSTNIVRSGVNVGRGSMEHRWGERIPCSRYVWISLGAGTGGTGRFRNVSASGAFVETSIRAPLLSPVVLTGLRDGPTGRSETEMRGSVIRAEPDGLAIEWSDSPEGSICALLGCGTRCAAPANPPCQKAG